MKAFDFDGKCYRSMRVFCKQHEVSYQKMRRLCRHYVRAHDDPSVAARWLLGLEQFRNSEPKTFVYQQDLLRAEERNAKFRDKMSRQFVENFS